MRPNETSFPYPVLGDTNAIPGEVPEASVIENIPLMEQIAIPYRWTFNVAIKNQDILKLIEEGKARYMCEVTCTATLLRRYFFSAIPKIEVEIDRKDVNKRVDFALYIVAVEHIANYDNVAATEDYRELAPFDLDAGSPLAMIKHYHWNADLCYEDLTSLRSILQILKNTANPNEEYVTLNLEHDYIQILIPPQQYEVFLGKSQSNVFSEVFKSSIVLYALQSALMALHADDPTRRWERALVEYVKHNNIFDGLSLGEPAEIPAIAARMLNNPFKGLSDVLPKMTVRNPSEQGAEEQDDIEDSEEEG